MKNYHTIILINKTTSTIKETINGVNKTQLIDRVINSRDLKDTMVLFVEHQFIPKHTITILNT